MRVGQLSVVSGQLFFVLSSLYFVLCPSGHAGTKFKYKAQSTKHKEQRTTDYGPISINIRSIL